MVKGQHLCVIVLHKQYLTMCPENLFLKYSLQLQAMAGSSPVWQHLL